MTIAIHPGLALPGTGHRTAAWVRRAFASQPRRTAAERRPLHDLREARERATLSLQGVRPFLIA